MFILLVRGTIGVMHDRILVAKLNNGPFYQGEALAPMYADPDYVGDDFERFKFRRTADGRFYGSIPRRTPTVSGKWLVVFIARQEDGLYRPVGWYEDATFNPSPQDRPEY